jgi:hypothetical protein
MWLILGAPTSYASHLYCFVFSLGLPGMWIWMSIPLRGAMRCSGLPQWPRRGYSRRTLVLFD